MTRRVTCFFCSKRTTNIKFHLKRCKDFRQISSDVFYHNILVYTRFDILTKTLHKKTAKYLKSGTIRRSQKTQEYINEKNIDTYFDDQTSIELKRWFTSPLYGQKYMKSFFFFENDLSFGIIFYNYKRKNNLHYKLLYYPDHIMVHQEQNYIHYILNLPFNLEEHNEIIQIVRRLIKLKTKYCDKKYEVKFIVDEFGGHYPYDSNHIKID